MNIDLEFEIDTPVHVTVDESGKQVNEAQVLRNAVEEAVLADAVGVDSYNVSEHYRVDFLDSAGVVLLAAIAARTSRIRLGTAVTVLSTQDPVRVFTEFSTLDAISSGRAQLIVGRASLTDSFPLFGYDLRDYDALFEEKLELFVKLLREQPVTWPGRFRPARYGLPLMIAAIGGGVERLTPLAELYRRALGQYGHGAGALPVGLHSPGFVADTDEEAAKTQYPYLAEMFAAGLERAGWRPTRQWYRQEIESGSFYIGSPETVAAKLAAALRRVGASRFDMALALGRVPHAQRLRAIELYGREVIPRVRRLLGD